MPNKFGNWTIEAVGKYHGHGLRSAVDRQLLIVRNSMEDIIYFPYFYHFNEIVRFDIINHILAQPRVLTS